MPTTKLLTLCRCDCGELTGSHFAAGHDATLLSAMLRKLYGPKPILAMITAHPDVFREIVAERDLCAEAIADA